MPTAQIDPRITGALKRRGLSIHRSCPTRDLIFDGLRESSLESLYQEMRRYSVRLALREMIKHPDGFTLEDLGRYAHSESHRLLIESLVDIGIVRPFQEGYRLARESVTSFGPTLEWFIARMMEREFASPALWGVTFRGTNAGGDFDVISYFEDALIYIEVTSSPPKGIEVTQAAMFLQRVNTLLPRAAFFFVDTQLRMRDRVVLLFHQDFLERMGEPYPNKPDLRNLEDEIFHIDHRIFILNAYRDAIKNFGICLRDYLARGLSI